MRAAGSGAWAGCSTPTSGSTRRRGVTGSIFSQTLPFIEPRVLQIYVDFEQALYASL